MPTYVFDISNHLNSVSGAGSIANGGVEISIVAPNSEFPPNSPEFPPSCSRGGSKAIKTH